MKQEKPKRDAKIPDDRDFTFTECKQHEWIEADLLTQAIVQIKDICKKCKLARTPIND